MNVLFAVVVIILALFTFQGYRKGLIRVFFSLISLFLTIGLVVWMSPYVSDFLEKTPVYHNIQQKCVESIQGKAQNEMAQEAGVQETIEIAGIEIPKEWQELLTQRTAETADGLLEQSGVYQEIGNYVAGIIINVMACVITFIVVFLVLRILINLLDIIAKLPVLNGMNHLGGTLAGAIEGIIVVWIIFFAITVCKSSELCQGLLIDINQNALLKILYENNLVEYILMRVIL
ncbi:CvpA family protein [Roseburia sp. 499]|uniref:CvpA family protein n=1 Tax=Roseburia sp. 499 TaxID=1261634 RepID=UPI00117993E5|nr:CvpA family protein [Roseburia sp. 499]WVK69584.1 CvpA family protein [Roseburia sp. 499]